MILNQGFLILTCFILRLHNNYLKQMGMQLMVSKEALRIQLKAHVFLKYIFIELMGIDPLYLNGIKDISVSQYPHEKTIYYCFSFASLMSVLTVLLSLWYLINNNRLINNPRRTFGYLISGIMGGILFGFTTFLPFFL